MRFESTDNRNSYFNEKITEEIVMTVCKRVISVMMCVAVIIGTMISANLSAKAESGSELMPGTINDLSFTNIVRSYLSVCEGGYMRVYVDKKIIPNLKQYISNIMTRS